MQENQIKNIVEAALLAAGRPLSLEQLAKVFGSQTPERDQLRAAVERLQEDYQGRGIMLAEVASGYRVQVRATTTEWVSRLWEERAPRYSRALLETLALIAYRQPITRGEIEEIRGVSVSSNIIRTLTDRGWVRIAGHRDVPGRPAIYATTREFLDYFGLRRLEDLPPLAELQDVEGPNAELDFAGQASAEGAAAPEPPDDAADREHAEAAVPEDAMEEVTEARSSTGEPGGTSDGANGSGDDAEADAEQASSPGATVVPLRRPDAV